MMNEEQELPRRSFCVLDRLRGVEEMLHETLHDQLRSGTCSNAALIGQYRSLAETLYQIESDIEKREAEAETPNADQIFDVTLEGLKLLYEKTQEQAGKPELPAMTLPAPRSQDQAESHWSDEEPPLDYSPYRREPEEITPFLRLGDEIYD